LRGYARRLTATTTKLGGISVTNEQYMRVALAEARSAAGFGEVPVGAVIIKDGIVIASAHNMMSAMCDPTAHAEIIAIKKACDRVGDIRLCDCVMFVTAEPCTMCIGAILNARIKSVYFGVFEPETGGVDSFMSSKNHAKIDFFSDILSDECQTVMKKFFKLKR